MSGVSQSRVIFMRASMTTCGHSSRNYIWQRVPRSANTVSTCCFVSRCLHGLAPSYLDDDFHRLADVDSRRRLWSAFTPALFIPTTHLSAVSDRAFHVAAARTWIGTVYRPTSRRHRRCQRSSVTSRQFYSLARSYSRSFT